MAKLYAVMEFEVKSLDFSVSDQGKLAIWRQSGAGREIEAETAEEAASARVAVMHHEEPKRVASGYSSSVCLSASPTLLKSALTSPTLPYFFASKRGEALLR